MSVLQLDPVTQLGIKYDQSEKKLVIKHYQDCSDIVEEMKRLRNGTEDKKAEFRLLASIPNTLIYKFKLEGIDIFRMKKDPSMRKAFLRKLQYEYPDLKAVNWKHLAK